MNRIPRKQELTEDALGAFRDVVVSSRSVLGLFPV